LRDLLRRWFLDNAALKVVALILAITLFILVSGEKESERSVRVGVAYVRPEDRVLVSEVPDSIEVWVRGPWTRIKRLDPADVDPIVVDLAKAGDGEIRFERDQVRLPAGLEVRAIRPSSIRVAFEHGKRVPVLPELVGAPAEGFIVEQVIADPPLVTVRGSQNAIAPVDEVHTLPLSIAGKRGNFEQRVALAPVGRGATAEVEEVDVDVQIVEEVRMHKLSSVKVALSPPPPRAAAASVEVVPPVVDVILRGGAAAMKEVDPAKVGAAVEARPEDYAPGASRNAPVLVTGVPPGVAVEVYPREITVSTRVRVERAERDP
jgi:YbbR domain-containing protein